MIKYYSCATATSLSIPGKQGNKPLPELHGGEFTPRLRQWHGVAVETLVNKVNQRMHYVYVNKIN